MSYVDSDEKLGSKAGKFAIFLVGAFLAKTAVSYGIDEYHRRHPNLDAAITKMKDQQPGMYGMFQSLKTSFPADYARIIAAVEGQVKAGASSEQIRVESGAQMRAFMRAHRNELAQAPSAQLAAWRAAQLAVTEALKADGDTLCAHFTTGTLLPTDQPSPASIAALGKAGQAQLAGIVAGTTSPARRSTALPAADAPALVAKMREDGATPEQLQIFASPTRLASAPPSTQCTIGTHLTRALTLLPADKADRISAYLITQQ